MHTVVTPSLLPILLVFAFVFAMWAVYWGLFYLVGLLIPCYRWNGVFNNRWELKVLSLGLGVFASLGTLVVLAVYYGPRSC